MSNVTALPAPKVRAEQPASQQSDVRRALGMLNRFLKGNRGNFMTAMVMLLVASGLDVLSSYPLPWLVEYLDKKRAPAVFASLGLTQPFASLTTTLIFVSVAIIVIALFGSITDSLSEIYLSKGGRQLGYNLRAALFGHLQKLSLAFFGTQRTGDLMTRVTSDVSAIEVFATDSLKDIAGSVFLLVLALIALFLGAAPVALVALLMVPVLSLVSNYFADRIKLAARTLRAREGDLASSTQEMLTSIRVIQTYGSGGNQIERFADLSKQTVETALHAARLQAWFSGVFGVLQSVTIVLVALVFTWLFTGQVGYPAAQLIAFAAIIDKMFKPTRRLIKQWNQVGKIMASVERIGEVLDRKPAVEDAPDAIQAPPFQGRIEFRHVSFAYQIEGDDDQAEAPTLALREINLDIAPGQVVALVGASGAGKSTFAQLLPRLYDPHAGQLLFDGQDIRAFTLESLRSHISMVLQETVLFTGTVAENIAYGRPAATREEIIAAAIQANAHEFIEKLPNGYDTMLSERAANLSGGQRQRLAIARAFIRNTPILILDEPTTGLDAESTDLVLTALRTLMKGKTTIIISHDLNLIRHADTIVVLQRGEIIQMGAHRELLKIGGLYADLYHKQFGSAMVEQGVPFRMAVPSTDHAPPTEEDDEEAEPVTPKIFQTLITRALPRPVSPRAFETLLMQAPLLAANQDAQREQESPPHSAPSVAPASMPAPPASPRKDEKYRSAIFQTTLLQMIPVPAEPVESVDGQLADGKAASLAPETAAPALQSQHADRRLRVAQLDPLRSPMLQRELPGLPTAFDGEAMRELLQKVLFGATHPRYQIERCVPGKAIYMGDSCMLRYQIQASAKADGQLLQPLVIGRVFKNQLDCAIYIRDKLSPLATLMRGREELAPFAMPIALIEPLNMVVHVFPIDGELPTLVGATDRERMIEVFRETLPEALDNHLVVEDCRVELVDYAGQNRCVLRYQVEGKRAGDAQAERQTIYGRVFGDTSGALYPPVSVALRERALASNGAYRINVPRSFGWRPDLQLALIEAIPGQPIIVDLLKAHMRGTPAPAAALTLEQMIEACGQVAALLHRSGIKLGHRRTFDNELAAIREELAPLQRLAPELGARMQGWIEQLGAYAEQSDPLPLCFSHGDFTHRQLIFDGPTAGLVDFDLICQAEPALDLGQFLAYLRVADKHMEKDETGGTSGLVEQLDAQFMDAYLATAADQIVDVERLRVRVSVYKVISLLRRVLRSWQQCKAGRVVSAIAILEEEIACLPELDY